MDRLIMLKLKNYLLFLSVPVLFFSCDDISKMSDQLDQMKDAQSQILIQQDKIIKGLAVLDKKVAGINTASKNDPKKDNNKRKTPNPDFVHNIEVGSSVVLGNPDAKITVTKFTDFQ